MKKTIYYHPKYNYIGILTINIGFLPDFEMKLSSGPVILNGWLKRNWIKIGTL